MKSKPIEQSKDPDLRGSIEAMRRAAFRAREIAKSTNTEIVVEINNELVYLSPDDPNDPLAVPDSAA
jgi:hypothetical protein